LNINLIISFTSAVSVPVYKAYFGLSSSPGLTIIRQTTFLIPCSSTSSTCFI